MPWDWIETHTVPSPHFPSEYSTVIFLWCPRSQLWVQWDATRSSRSHTQGSLLVCCVAFLSWHLASLAGENIADMQIWCGSHSWVTQGESRALGSCQSTTNPWACVAFVDPCMGSCPSGFWPLYSTWGLEGSGRNTLAGVFPRTLSLPWVCATCQEVIEYGSNCCLLLPRTLLINVLFCFQSCGNVRFISYMNGTTLHFHTLPVGLSPILPSSGTAWNARLTSTWKEIPF